MSKIILYVIPFWVSRLLSPFVTQRTYLGFRYPLTLQQYFSEFKTVNTRKRHVITYNTMFQTLVSPVGLTLQLYFMSFELHEIFKLFIAWYTLKTSNFLMFPFVHT